MSLQVCDSIPKRRVQIYHPVSRCIFTVIQSQEIVDLGHDPIEIIDGIQRIYALIQGISGRHHRFHVRIRSFQVPPYHSVNQLDQWNLS
jgi:hypothetical protein